MKINFTKINHIQICIPFGEEEKGRKFYCEILGLKEIEKPEFMKKNGGFWVEVADMEIHIGTEDLPGISKRHPAFEIENSTEVKKYLKEQGLKVKDYESLPNFTRFSVFDYWDNRIELLEAIDS